MNRYWIPWAAAVLLGGCAGEPSTDRSEPAPSGPTAAPRVEVTFSEHIAPILHKHCIVCHRPGESAPFPLLTYEDAKSHASQAAVVTKSGFMPPWLPERGFVPHAGERGLSPEEIRMFADWAEAGAPEGDPSRTPVAPQFVEGWRLGEPDLIASMSESYIVPASGPEIFRNFVIPLELSERRFVEAVEFRVGNPKVVHHLTLQVDRTRASRRLDERDPEPGYPGMEASPESANPQGQLLGWTPGKSPSPPIEDLAWPLDRGSDLVLQLHLLPSGRTETIQTSVGFHFAAAPPKLRPLSLRLGPKTIDVPPEAGAYTITDSFVLPVPVEAYSVYPHAHYLGKELSGFAQLPNGGRLVLVQIKNWDFNWQDQYVFKSPLFLPAGTRLEMQFTYDNSSANPRNPSIPPARVRFGPRSVDEMGDLWIQLAATNDADANRLLAEYSRKEIETNVEGYRKAAVDRPRDAETQTLLGISLMDSGRVDESIYAFESALNFDPRNARAAFGLGNAYRSKGEPGRAKEFFQKAIDIDPRFSAAHNNLAFVLLAEGNRDEAVSHLVQALEEFPDYPEANFNMGNVYAESGEYAEAVPWYQRALAARPEYADAWSNLGVAFGGLGRVLEAVDCYQKALLINPRLPDAHNSLGAALGSRGDLDAAIHHFQEALKIDPNHRQANMNLRGALAQKRSSGAVGP